ncbi:MAG: SOS response-associated peptidase [Acetivibrionales bacterium]|jgi:putative SOS response-associated peptidase YedK
MCGRFLLFDEAENEELRRIINEINKKYNQDEYPKLKTGEIFPTNYAPVITAGNNNTVSLFKWGFPNYKNTGTIINARSETLEERPAFRKILLSKRCLIPASGFYEWKQTGSKKDKYLIQTEKPLFYMAGLYNHFTDKNGIPFTAFVIITTDANREVLPIHHRMPVILERDSGKLWLESMVKDALNLLIPYQYPLKLTKIS